MKKLNIIAGLALGLVALFAGSCDDDRDNNPVLDTAPTEFKLNTPALANQNIETDDNSTLALSWSQPNYGFPTVPTYKVQVGEVGSDGKVNWQVDENGNPVFLKTTYKNTVSANISAKEVARALCKIDGVTTEDQYVDKGYQKVAFRVYAGIDDANAKEVANSGIFSNVVYYNHLKSYFSVATKSWIYLIGQPSGWSAPSTDNEAALEAWKIYETEPESGIFVGTFHINAGQFSLRFYKTLAGWGDNGTDNGIAANSNDGDNKTIVLKSNVYTGEFVGGKGNWIINDFPGGDVQFTIDTNSNTVTFELK
jgi:hypothetical protein